MRFLRSYIIFANLIIGCLCMKLPPRARKSFSRRAMFNGNVIDMPSSVYINNPEYEEVFTPTHSQHRRLMHDLIKDKHIECRVNEVVGCKSICEVQCPRADRPPPSNCPPCSPGCVCAPGFVRDTLSGYCVPGRYCPFPDDMCVTKEQFVICGAGCEITCDDISLNKRRECSSCMTGYVCTEGYVRDLKSGRCVTASECPAPCLSPQDVVIYSRNPNKRHH